MDGQAGLLLCYSQHPKDRFSCVEAHIPITNTSIELFVFWLSDTESWINKLRFSDSVLLSFKTRLMLVTCFCGDVAYKVNFKHATRDGKHDYVTSRNLT